MDIFVDIGGDEEGSTKDPLSNDLAYKLGERSLEPLTDRRGYLFSVRKRFD